MHRLLFAAVAASLLSAAASAQQITAANGDCASAYTPALTGGVYSADTTGGSASGLLAAGLPPFVNDTTPDTACALVGAMPTSLNIDVFAWVQPPVSGSYLFSTCGAAQYDTKLAIYSGTCGAEIALACNDDRTGCSSFTSELNVTGLVADQPYLLQIGGFAPNKSGPSSVTMSQTTVAPSLPPNDTCANARTFMNGANVSNTSQATASGQLSTGLAPFCNYGPDRACSDSDDLGRDIWFEFTPTTAGDYVFSTCGMSSYDNKLSLYEGDCGALVALACADLSDPASGCGFPLHAMLNVSGLTAGATYYLQVGGFSNQAGSCSITAALASFPPPTTPWNDSCMNAAPIGLMANPVDTTSACPSGIEPSGLPPFVDISVPYTACNDWGGGPTLADDMGSDAFYRFAPALNGNYRFSTCGSVNFDSKLALYSGSCDALVPIACNDDGQIAGATCFGFTSVIEASGLVSGVTYTVQLGGFGAATGTGTLDVSLLGMGSLGMNYCSSSPNDATPIGSTEGARIYASGSLSILANDLVVTGGPIKPNEPGILYHGVNRVNGGLGLPFGDGRRCVGGETVRYFPPVFSNPGGMLVIPIDNTAAFLNLPMGAPLFAGALRHFQYWYRSPTGPFGLGGQTGFNLTDAITLLFTP